MGFGLGGLSEIPFVAVSDVQARFAGDADTYQDTGFATPAASNGDAVGGWKDQTSHINHATQGTAGNKATLNAAAVNGRNTVGAATNGTSTVLGLASSITLTGTFSIYAVAVRTAGQKLTLVGKSDSSAAIYFWVTNALDVQTDAGGFTGAGVTATGTFGVRVRRAANDHIYALCSGQIEVDLGSLAGTITLDQVFAGTASGNNSAAASSICEMIITNVDTSVVSPTEDVATLASLASRWGITW